MGILHKEIRPKTLLIVGLIAVFMAALSCVAGMDGSGILLAFLLFSLAAYAAYVSDPQGGNLSRDRGALVGGLTMLVWVPVVDCRSSYKERGTPFPNSIGEALILGVGLVLFSLIGVGFGAMVAVIGGRAIRVVGSLARPASWSGKAKYKRTDVEGFEEEDFVG